MTTPAPTANRDGRSQRLERYERYVAHVRQVCERDAGRRAALRRCLGRPPEKAESRAHAVVAPFLPEPVPGRRSGVEERAFYAIAALIAAQPRSARDQDRSDAEPPEDTVTDAGERAVPPEPSPGEPERAQRVNLGTTLAGAVPQVLSEHTAEARLHLLARQGVDGCHRHLPALVQLLRSHQERVDWVQLLDDLVRLGWDRDEVTKRWLQSFHRALFRRGANPTTPNSPSTTDHTGDIAP